MSTMFAVTTVTYTHNANAESHGELDVDTRSPPRKRHARLNLADYLYDFEAVAKETGELGNLKITCTSSCNKSALQPRFKLHRLAVHYQMRHPPGTSHPAPTGISHFHRYPFLYV